TMIGIGFLLLSITIFTGIFFSQEIFNSAFVFNHKTLFGIFSWIFYGYIFYQRQINGLRGRKAIKLSLFAFILLVLSYFGSKFVFEYLIG
ncbi:MAG: cytochrome C biogenesis protein, partial [Betaproteobacteria bacterium]|nr:cytochrome C biogenesis protein [Betaproteobacteria bacterium]